jgi:hypothetical protein
MSLLLLMSQPDGETRFGHAMEGRVAELMQIKEWSVALAQRNVAEER